MKTLSRPRLAVLVFLVALAPALRARALPSGVTLDIGPTSASGTWLSYVWLANSGQVVYRWTTDGYTATGLSSWSPATGDTVVVGQQGQQAAGAPPGVVYTSFFGPPFPYSSRYDGMFAVNDAGQVAFKNEAAVPGAGIAFDGSNSAVWGPGAGGNLAIVARFGQPLPGDGSGGLVWAWPYFEDEVAEILESNIVLDDMGRTTFATRLQAGTGGTTIDNDRVLYRSDGAGGGSIIAREGDQAPGKPPGTTYSGLHVAFRPFESHAGTGFKAQTTAGSVIYGEDGAGGFTPLVSAGDVAPGTAGAVFGDFYDDLIRINAHGELTFQAILWPPGVGDTTAANDEGIWGPNGLIVRQGDPAPGVPGATFSAIGDAALGDSGIAFLGGLIGGAVTPANDGGVWEAGNDGRMILLARTGDPVPGLPGATFADFGKPATNARQDTAFIANFAVGSGGVTPANDEALFFADANGALTLLLREGNYLPGLGTLRQFEIEQLPGSALNDARQLLLDTTFEQSDSTNVTAEVVLTVPEPGTTLPLALGFGLLGVLHRRRQSSSIVTQARAGSA